MVWMSQNAERVLRTSVAMFSIIVTVVHHLISTRQAVFQSPYLLGQEQVHEEVKYLIIGA